MNIANPDKNNQIDLMLQQTPVAIIGIAALFPDSRNVEEYWENIVNEVDTIKDVPPSRWAIEDYYDPDPKVPDKTYSKRGGFIPDIDFNPMEFGLPPNILEVTDVSQLLAMVVAKKVLEDAGYGDENRYSRENIGITLGVGGGQKLITPLTTRLQYPIWKKALTTSGISEEDTNKIIEKIKKAYIGWEENSFPGMLGNVITGRVANRLNLGGTNCVLDAACASSLTAIKMAISDLLEYRSEIMISGGVDMDNSPFMYMSFSKTPAFTPEDKCRPFDADSKGMLIGEGIGMVALKRLSDAKRDNDRIYAVIKGLGSSSDGRYKSIYAPRPEGQAIALKQAYKKAGFAPDTIGLIEAHGTGTEAGDEAEFTALKAVFGEGNPRKQHIAIGSVKSQIGHTKAAAGSAGCIKAALALYHRILPATINVEKPHPKMDIKNSPFYINTATRPWFQPENGTPRRASVSAFGFGGTNFHLVLEEYTGNGNNTRKHNAPYMILLSDKTPERLVEKCRQLQTGLTSEACDHVFFNFISENGIKQLPSSNARLGFICSTLSEAIEMIKIATATLESTPSSPWENPKGIYYQPKGLETANSVVALFSGQGSQYINMGKELAINFPLVMDSFSLMDKLFTEEGKHPLTQKVFPIPVFTKEDEIANKEALQKTEIAQPSIGALSAGMYNVLKEAGFEPHFTAGHSFGELTALYAANVLSMEDYLFLAKERGKAMAAPDGVNFDAGIMLAVIGDIEKIAEGLKGFTKVKIANSNSDKQAVIAGPKKETEEAAKQLKSMGFKIIPLSVSAAFHTHLVKHAQKPFAKAVDSVKFTPPECAVYSNSTGKPYPENAEGIRQILKQHLLNPVLFKDEIENIYQAGGRIFIEFGPKNVLTKLVGEILKDKPHTAIALNIGGGSSDMQFRYAVAKLCVAGIDIADIDPCMKLMKPPTQKGSNRLNVKLNGSNYVSDKTRKAFIDALNDDFTINKAELVRTPPTETIASKPVPEKAEREKMAYLYPSDRPIQEETVESTTIKTDPMKSLSNTKSSATEEIVNNTAPIFKHQSETLAVHSQYLSNMKDYTQYHFDLMRQHNDLLKEQPGIKLSDAVENSMNMFHEHYGETLKVHEQYLNNQAAYTSEAIAFLKEGYRGSLPAVKASFEQHEITQNVVIPELPASGTEKVLPKEARRKEPETLIDNSTTQNERPPAANDAENHALIDIKKITSVMLEIVSEKTGYPAEMLEMDMDMEADLGIDSIKRVEILSGLSERIPGLPDANPEELAEMKTLGEIVAKFGTLFSGECETPCSPETINEEVQATRVDITQLNEILLKVVSDKTGYPTEMLEMDMEMEADLGIDSIKRVEILSALTEQIPDLPDVNPEELAELKTLGEIIDKFQTIMPLEKKDLNDFQPGMSSDSQTEEVTTEKLTEVMLEVVSEKTGYPPEMLEMDMDMESDLGIDSIKRVEILSGIMERFPLLPEIVGETLAELRTLEDVVRHISMEIKSKSEPQATVVSDLSQTYKQKVKRSIAILKELPDPDFIEFDWNQDDVVLITDDGTLVTSGLSEALLDRGFKVAVISFPDDMVQNKPALKKGIKRFVLSGLKEENLKSLLENIAAQFKSIGGFIHLNPPPAEESRNSMSYPEMEKDMLLLVFLFAKLLKQDLTTIHKYCRKFFITACHLDGMLGTSGKDYSLVSSGLFGLVKTLNLEWEKVFCRAVDIGNDDNPEKNISNIIKELNDPDQRIVETAYGPKGRVTLESIESEGDFEEKDNLINSDAVFLVTGGAKGVTAECTAKLSQICKCSFILLGRSVYQAGREPAWAKGIEDLSELKMAIMNELKNSDVKPTPKKVDSVLYPILSTREIHKSLARIRQSGAKAEYISTSVTDAKNMQKQLKPLIEKMGPITGIIHGAGVLADKLIEDKTTDDFKSVFAPKVEGLETLLDCIDPEKLTHMSIFSSAAGFFGNTGQSDYAIANEILNKSALRFKAIYPDCHVTTFNWGPWDGGMVTPELKRMFSENNIDVIPLEEGSTLFANELCSPNHTNQILVGSSLQVVPKLIDQKQRSYRITRRLRFEDNPFLKDHVIGGNPVLPTVCAISWMAETCEKLYPGFTFYSACDYKVFKGIVFDGTQSERYIMDIAEKEKNSSHIEFDFRVSSLNKGGKQLHHHAAIIKLAHHVPEPQMYQHANLELTQIVDGSRLYSDGTLFHGPYFQAIERVINISETKLTMECRLPEIPERDMGQFRPTSFNPYAADVQFQCMLIWVRQYMGAGSLPTKAQEGIQFKPVPSGRKFYVSLDVKHSSETSMTADIITHDRDGSAYTWIKGAEVTISKQLNHLFYKTK